MALLLKVFCFISALLYSADTYAISARSPASEQREVSNQVGAVDSGAISSVSIDAPVAYALKRREPASSPEGLPGVAAAAIHQRKNDEPARPPQQLMNEPPAFDKATAHPQQNEKDARKAQSQMLKPDVLAAEVATSDKSTSGSAWVFLAIAFGFSLLCLGYEFSLPKEAPPPGPPGQTGSLAQMDSWDVVNFAFVTVVIFAHLSMFVQLHFKKPINGFGVWYHGIPYAMPGLIVVSGVRSTLSERCVGETLVGLPCTVALFGLLVSFMSRLTPGPRVLAIGMGIVDWYLMALFCWRLAVGPVFALTRCCELPTAIPFTVVFLTSYLLWQYAFPIWEPVGSIIDNDASFFTVPWHLWVSAMPLFTVGHAVSQEQWQNLLFGRHSFQFCSAFLVLYTLLMVIWPGFREWWSASCVQDGQCTYQNCPVELLDSGVSAQSFGVFVKVFLQKVVVVLCIISVIGTWGTPLRRHMPRLGAIVLGCGKRWVYVFLLHWVLFCMPAARVGVATLVFGQPSDNESLDAPYIVEPFLLIFAFGSSLVLGSRLAETLFCWLFLLPGWVWACCFLPASHVRGRRAGPPPSEFIPERKSDEFADEDEGAKLSATAWLASLPKTPGFLAGRPRQQAHSERSSSASSNLPVV